MNELLQRLDRGSSAIKNVYGLGITEARARLERCARGLDEFTGVTSEGGFFSCPGRTEIGGNHTDHNHGRVLAAAVEPDIAAAAAPNISGVINLRSEGFGDCHTYIMSLDPDPVLCGTTTALIRGVCDGMKKRGRPIGGFDAYVSSRVPMGGGLSSSASFEVLIATILDHLFGKGDMPFTEAAMIAQYAENVHFGKPSGLMDQTACASGGFVAIDFANPSKPVVHRLDMDFSAFHHTLVLTGTGSGHTDLTGEYASIPEEMISVAKALGKDFLRGTTIDDIMASMPRLRDKAGDRAVLRAIHFINEDIRADKERASLENGNFDEFLSLVRASGSSSWRLLQNCFAPGSRDQGLCLALAASDELLNGRGASRVHGGGFAGTIQAFVPDDLLGSYVRGMDSCFGPGSAKAIAIRRRGAVKIDV